jgi:hypothetical protein
VGRTCYASGVSPRIVSLVALAAFVTACSDSHDRSGSDAPVDTDAGHVAPEDSGGPPRKLPDVVADFVKAWGTPDADERAALLKASFSADGVYTDPAQSLAGRDALGTAIASLQKSMPGAALTATSGIDQMRGQYRVAWKLVSGDGTTVQSGEDEGEVGADGKITRVTGFFDPAVAGTAPAGLTAFVAAGNAKSKAALTSGLASAVSDAVVWTDLGAHTENVQDLADYLGVLFSPGGGAEVGLEGTLDAYGGFARTGVLLAGGYAASHGQLIAHAGSDERLDWISYFTGPLPPP